MKREWRSIINEYADAGEKLRLPIVVAIVQGARAIIEAIDAQTHALIGTNPHD